MTTPYPGTPTFHDTVDILDDGDLAEALTLAPALEAHQDSLQFLATRVGGTTDDDLIWVPFPSGTPGDKFILTTEGLTQADLTSAIVVIDLQSVLPKNCTIKEVHATLVGAAGHAGDPPATTMPRVQLFSKDPGSAVAAVQVGVVTDATALSADYEDPHPIAITGLSAPVSNDGGLRYYLQLRGESGGNAIVGLNFNDLYLVVDP